MHLLAGVRRNKLPLLLIAINVICLSVYSALPAAESRGAVLPLEFRIGKQQLSNFPVEITHLQTCGCWVGPRVQAEKKFKLTIGNHSRFTLNIGGGERSAIRLIVGYPGWFTPKLTVPDENAFRNEDSVADPSDANVWNVAALRNVKASLIPNGSDLFPLPPSYRVWAVPPNPNKIVENLGKKVTFPTFVDQETLRPGQTYGSAKLGHGDWVFYLPLEKDFARAGDFEVILPRSETEKYVIVLGVAVFAEPQSDGEPQLVGFAAAPPDSAALDPGDL